MTSIHLDRHAFHIETSSFALFIASTKEPRANGEPWAWTDKTPQGCTHGRIGPVEFSWQRGK